MFDFRSAFSVMAVLAASASGCAYPGPSGEDGIEKSIEDEVKAGRAAGFPDLSALRVPEGRPPRTADVVAALGALEEEAERLRILRAAAARPPSTAPLEAKAAELQREIEEVRAVLALSPPIDRESF